MIKLIKVQILIITFLSVSMCAKAQDKYDSKEVKINSFLQKYKTQGSPGCAVAVIDNGEIAFKKTYGLANLEYEIPLSSNSRFHIASCSKTFTAYAILLLESQGKLCLNDDIRKYLPELPIYKHTVNIDHLLHHTSGLRGMYGTMFLTGWDWSDELTNEQFLRVFKHQNTLDAKPSDYYSYCNTNYLLLAEIIKRVTKKDFNNWMKENVFSPIGMENTTIVHNENEIVENKVRPYSLNNNSFLEKSYGGTTVGATGVYSTIEDMSKWIIFFNNQYRNGSPIIKKMIETTTTSKGLYVRYARGVIKDTNPDCYWHSGSMGGYKSFVLYLPEYNHGVVILGNLSQLNVVDLSFEISAVFHPDLYPDIIEKWDEDESNTNSEKLTNKNLGTIHLDSNQLKDFCNFYAIGNSYGFKIFLKTDSLKMKGAWFAGTRTLLPISDSSFIFKNQPGELTFIRNSNQVIDSIKYVSGREYKAYKVGHLEEDIYEYCGEYNSKEVGLTIKIIYENNQFYAIPNSYRMETIGLYKTRNDYMLGDFNFFSKIKFKRNESNKIEGFVLEKGHRIYNLNFLKQ